LDTVVNLLRKTATKTGLTTTVRVMKKVYETGRKATQDFRDTISFRWDKVLPKWNYTAIPQ
jgi:heterodisulfide reductase subunit C